jgi:hypothetical protein
MATREDKMYRIKAGSLPAERLDAIIDKAYNREGTVLIQNGDFLALNITDNDSEYYVTSNNYHPRERKVGTIRIAMETAEDYQLVSLPQTPPWITAIFDGSAEKEEILLLTEQFYVLPDPKWDRKPQNAYLLAIFKDSNLKSLRDLRAHHIPLLEGCIDVVSGWMTDKYGLDRDEIRIFIHYPPSAWRLHIHFQALNADNSLGSNVQCGRAHLLQTVIYNLSIADNYYRDASLSVLSIDKNEH